jgi:hypothetical protein
LYNFAIPLAIGGLFCAGLLYHHLHGLLSPATLIFYGLALFNAGNYTFSDVKYLGLVRNFFRNCICVLFRIWFIFLGNWFWSLHIVYGIVMHKKYK